VVEQVLLALLTLLILLAGSNSLLAKLARETYRGERNTTHFPSHFFNTVDKKGYAGGVLCLKEINYANKGSHALLLAHCRTDVHRQKVYNVITYCVAQGYHFCVQLDSTTCE
jgi:hypothetical protein